MPTFLTKNRQRKGRWIFRSKWGIPAVQDLKRELFQSSEQNALLLYRGRLSRIRSYAGILGKWPPALNMRYVTYWPSLQAWQIVYKDSCPKQEKIYPCFETYLSSFCLTEWKGGTWIGMWDFFSPTSYAI